MSLTPYPGGNEYEMPALPVTCVPYSVTEAHSTQYPTLAPWDQKGLEGSQIHFPDREGRKTQRRKRRLRIFLTKAVLVKGWFPRSRLHDHPGSCARLVSSGTFSFLRWWTSLTSKGLVLGQAFSIQWDLPVSDLPRSSTAFLSSPLSPRGELQGAGCLWEVRAREQIASVSRKL